MALTDLPDWLDEHKRPPTAWFVKRLQANDTLATGSHQAGPYLPKEFLFAVFPELRDQLARNPRVELNIYVDSQSDHRIVHAIWYNNRLRGGTRSETRITGFGGAQSDLLDPESTGAVVVLAFDLNQIPRPTCHAWVCRDETESDLIEAIVGRIYPGLPVTWTADSTPNPDWFRLKRRRRALQLIGPTGADDAAKFGNDPESELGVLVSRSVQLQSLSSQSVDIRLLRRHEQFVDLYQMTEERAYAERIRGGFPDISSLFDLADQIRVERNRHGDDALALHLRFLLEEEGIAEGLAFSFRPTGTGFRTPDFLFPAKEVATRSGRQRQRALLVEPAIRDRWKAAVEALELPVVHILTLQRGVSLTQFRDMTEAGITLVVPARLHDTFPTEIRSELVTLESFFADIRYLAQSTP